MSNNGINENQCGMCGQDRKLETFENPLSEEMGGGYVGTAVMVCGCGYDVRAKRFTKEEAEEVIEEEDTGSRI